jgi:dihydropyrimidinase
LTSVQGNAKISSHLKEGDLKEMTTTLIKGGSVVLGQAVSQQDILIEGERISAIGDLTGIKAGRGIDAKGLIVMPGAVDPHVHFNDEFMNTVSVHDYYSGTLAAAFGGTTSILDFSNQLPDQPLIETIKIKKAEAEGRAIVDWGVHPVITDLKPEILEEIPRIIQAGAPSFKCYMTYRSEGLMIEENDMWQILETLKMEDGMLMVHAEDNDLIEENVSRMIRQGLTRPIYHARSRPPEAEIRAVQGCIKLARETGARILIVHMATAAGVELIGEARGEGLEIMAETCTHYLVFTDAMLEREDGIKWICSPPLRNKRIQDRLWAGLRDGRLSLVTSDDSAYSWEAKQLGADRFDRCPNGIPGVEVRLPLLYSEGVAKGRLSLPRLVELLSTTPSILFGLYPRKGTLCPGADADIVLFDPGSKWTMNRQSLHMAPDWSAYEEIPVTGKIAKVFSRGELIVDGDTCLAKKGRGRYLHRKIDFTIRPSL